METNGRIIVGYDGSREAARAVRWAARQAEARSCPLQLVHCSLWPAITRDLDPVPGVAGSGLKHSAETIVAEGVATAREGSRDVQLITSLVYGWPAENLRKLSRGAAMLVVGSRGMGGFMGLLVGSVSLELAATAPCPVAVIRPAERSGGPVVVGIAEENWEPVLGQAARFASVMRAPLRILHVTKRQDERRPEGGDGAREMLASAVRSVRNTVPVLEIEDVLLTGHSVAGALLGAAVDAQILVVGTTGYGAVRGSIGSAAHAVLHHAVCPVLVVRPEPVQQP